MVHWFVFYTLEEWWSIALPLNAFALPISLHEGYAQFFSGERWGMNRGDRYLRTFALADSDRNTTARWRGGYMYADGFGFVKYLSEFYGEDKLIELLKERRRFGIFNFDKAFEKVFEGPYADIYREWTRYMRAWYYGDAFMHKLSLSDSFSRELSINAIEPFKTNVTISDFVIKIDQVIANVRISENQRYRSLIYGTLNIDSLRSNKFHINDFKVLENANNFIDFDICSNGRYAVWSRMSRHKHGRIAPKVFFRDVENKRNIILGEGSIPVVRDDGVMFFQRRDLEENTIMKYTHLSPPKR
jgi:hypothetical protein